MSRYGSSDHPGQPDDESTGRAAYSEQGPQPYSPPPIPAGPGYGPGEAPTRYAGSYAEQGSRPPGGQELESVGFPAITEPEQRPWFRRRSVLIGWFILIAIMIALVFWGIVQLTSRGPEKAPAPSTTTSTTTTTTATTTTTTSSPAAPPGGAPPERPAPPAEPPAVQPPHHRPHLPPLPSVITIPPIPRVPEVPTVITLPGR